ncbi:MAG TPA: PilZ domain-containing protein [Azonexus sp.]|nr:PilZ domain-containing protein [Azonexus sp.]
MSRNRRQFSRIHFEAEARLFFPDGELAVELVDLSLKGALIRPKGEFFVTVGTGCTLKIQLDDAATVIRMESTIVHHQGPFYGLACREIDLDSVTHLRRLVALNLGDEDLLERELTLLTTA